MKNYYYDGNPNNDIDIYKLYMDQIGSHTILSHEEIVELIKKAQAGDENARNEIIEHNLKLVARVAKRFARTGMSIMDAIQIGNENIINCINYYDVNSQTPFSHYLARSVQYTISKNYSKIVSSINYSYGSDRNTNKIKKYCDDFYRDNEREATDDEIASALNVKQYDIDLYRRITNKQFALSLDSTSNDISDGGYDQDTLHGIIGVEDENFDRVLSRLTKEKIVELMDKLKLNDREKFMLLYRYGFIDKEGNFIENGKMHTLEEVGQMYNLTRERIRQIESNSLRKLRRSRKFRKIVL